MDDEKNNFESLKDLTDFVTIEGPAPGTADKTAKSTGAAPALVPTAEQGDHPGIALLDIAIEESVRYCEKEHFPPPNLSLWQNFSRGFLNKSLWHYFPTGAEPDSPAICALIGIAGLAVCYTPVIIAFYEAKQKETIEKKEKDIREHNRKVAQLRADRRASGLDANTGEPLITRAPGQQGPEQPEEPEPEILNLQSDRPPRVPLKVSQVEEKPAEDWFMTTAKPVPAIARRIESAEPAAPGMG
jgi:hypothetical protein